MPLAHDEAVAEVHARLAAPGQGLSYALGKRQLLSYMEKAREAAERQQRRQLQQPQQQQQPQPQRGAAAAAVVVATNFSLAAFHASLLEQGNLPFVLQAHAPSTCP